MKRQLGLEAERRIQAEKQLDQLREAHSASAGEVEAIRAASEGQLSKLTNKVAKNMESSTGASLRMLVNWLRGMERQQVHRTVLWWRATQVSIQRCVE